MLVRRRRRGHAFALRPFPGRLAERRPFEVAEGERERVENLDLFGVEFFSDGFELRPEQPFLYLRRERGLRDPVALRFVEHLFHIAANFLRTVHMLDFQIVELFVQVEKSFDVTCCCLFVEAWHALALSMGCGSS